jgi:hypothetical protein
MQVDVNDMRFLRDQALRKQGFSAHDIKALHQADARADLIGTAMLAGGLAAIAAVEVIPLAMGTILSNPVTTNEIGIAITEALSPGAESSTAGAVSKLGKIEKSDRTISEESLIVAGQFLKMIEGGKGDLAIGLMKEMSKTSEGRKALSEVHEVASRLIPHSKDNKAATVLKTLQENTGKFIKEEGEELK